MSRRLLPLALLIALPVAAGCRKRAEVPSWFRASASTAAPAKTASPTNPKAELENRVERLEGQLRALDRAGADLEKQRKEIVERLKRADVRSSDDLKKSEIARNLARLLAEVRQELTRLELKREEFAVAHDNGRAVLRRLQRQQELREAGVGDEELDRVSEVILRIDERLKQMEKNAPPPQVDLETVLDEELKAGR